MCFVLNDSVRLCHQYTRRMPGLKGRETLDHRIFLIDRTITLVWIVFSQIRDINLWLTADKTQLKICAEPPMVHAAQMFARSKL